MASQGIEYAAPKVSDKPYVPRAIASRQVIAARQLIAARQQASQDMEYDDIRRTVVNGHVLGPYDKYTKGADPATCNIQGPGP